MTDRNTAGAAAAPGGTGGRAPVRRGRRWIEHWDPEDEAFWRETGRRTARRNLAVSVLTEHLGFAVWSLWSVLVLFLGPAYGIDAAGKFGLVAVATLAGAVLRVPYTVAAARFGGRDRTVAGALLLVVPAAAAALVVARPGAPYGAFLAAAALTGAGGGSFASSMANVNAFYPQRRKGWALGLNAGGGNLGVPAVQLLGLLVLGTAGSGHPWLVPAGYLPLAVLAAVLAARRMDNLGPVRHGTGAVAEAARDRHTWLLALLYLGTFGSFIGYSFAFGLVLQYQFARTPLQAAALTFAGPLLGSLARPAGGWLADRYGGARVALGAFAALGAATGVVLAASGLRSLPLFLAGFTALFVVSGAGNGATYKMIPAVFRVRAARRGLSGAAATASARRLAGAAMGLIGAVGALGGLGVDLAFREAFAATGSGVPAFAAFLVCYAVCGAVTRCVYLRRPVRGGPAPEPDGAARRPVAADVWKPHTGRHVL
ncbi:MFS transporter [Streptomyces sp. RS10V-4]|uniref:MFS transporter n=1 Tax=Streptomyces rhizoryzae TaxID=2932493 RepID=UPI0020045F87|nr:MFS transporter [Streptomyces rhizoryzae]MCK7623923.1 MFS transporter [Streptomyces rhizoryzae]